jgi:hypothetical protein
MQGQGNFPCLGNSQCKNSLSHRTTTFLHQLKPFFNDIEWRHIKDVSNTINQRQKLNYLTNYHPYLSPLISINKVSVELVIQTIKNILSQDIARVKCPVCSVTIQKTTDCYSIRHCDWEVCWMCHKVDRRLPIDHWKTCPRYDYDVAWKSFNYQCEEGKCYNEDTQCCNLVHEQGIKNMNKVRKSFQLHRLINSVSDELKKEILLYFSKSVIRHEFESNIVLFEKSHKLFNKY